MAKSEILTLQIDSTLKEQAEALFSSLGLTHHSLFRGVHFAWWHSFST